MVITRAEIKEDIEAFNKRITDAENKLNALPLVAGTWQARARVKVQRQALNDNIRHIRQLIIYAREGLTTS